MVKKDLIETEAFYYRLICNGQEMIIRVLYAIFGKDKKTAVLICKKWKLEIKTDTDNF